jgi:predicted nucleic acid-binding protein
LIVVVADTSGLLAALDDSHPARDAARVVLQTAGTLVVSPVLLSELDHVARRVLGRRAAHAAIDDIRYWARAGRAVIPPITPDILDTAQAVRLKYADLELDLADAVNVALAAEFRTSAVFTLDRRDFRAARPLTAHEAFVLLPDDLS